MSLGLRFSSYGKFNICLPTKDERAQETRDKVYVRHSRVGIWIVAIATPEEN